MPPNKEGLVHCSTGSQNTMGKSHKSHFWLNQVHVACLEPGRNFRQALMFCAEDTVLSVLSELSPRLSNKEVKEEMMRCFSPIPMRRQAIEMMRTMRQEDDKQMCQYIMRHMKLLMQGLIGYHQTINLAPVK